ncbi:calcium-activated chloride channel regulator 1-like [Sycon ciliatum]|uniref:calcium-activated chloride channel regulator 1-like n=1 Tax=Sycon ciliatum TaxID=27933 RepID=UPI0031F7161A|eukprot:scpid28726/ scgid17725/ Calcium-activated chloride channel regulator 1; Calcium-activated chloride channel family member 3; Protein gob-5
MRATYYMQRIAAVVVLLSVALCSHSGVHASCSIQLNNGRFSWMVGINDDVLRTRSRGDRHDYRDLKEAIVEKFTLASQWLYRATKQRAYVGDITVVVPDTWRGDPSFECAKQCETYERAKIKIRQPRVDSRGRELHGAYVVPGRCGEEGMLMHLTASRIAAASHQASPAEKMIVHEFAHLRYGVGDEYYQSVYGYGADGKPSACSVKVEPKISRFSGRYSGFETHDAQASFMWHQFRDQIVHFCEKSDPRRSVQHNRLAANSHNQRCNRQSVWEVLEKSQDFCCNRNRPMRLHWQNVPKPTFRFVRKCLGGCEVVAVDVSASMKGRMMEVNQAVANVIDRATSSLRMGLVTFAEQATVVAGLQAADGNYKQHLKRSLPSDNQILLQKTSLFQGLQRAAQVLTTEPTCQQKRITVVSDCGETTPQKLTRSMLLMLQQNGIQMNALTFDDDAPKCPLLQLSQLSEGSACNQGDMLASDAAMADCTTPKVIRPHFQMTTVAARQRVCHKVCIDPDIGVDTQFSVNWDSQTTEHVANKLFYVTSPSSMHLRHSNGPNYQLDNNLMMSSMTVVDASTGYWNLCIRNRMETTATFTTNVGTNERRERCAIKAEGHLSSMSVVHPEPVLLMVEVSKCMMPVLDALVTCQVTRPNSEPAMVMLRDDGMGDDDLKMDGVYSATFSQYMGDGQYNVHCKATCQRRSISDDGLDHDDEIITMVRNAPKRMDDAGEESDQRMDGMSMDYPDDDRTMATGMDHCCFERHLSLGAFSVFGFELGKMQILEKDMVPPAMVNDLKLVSVDSAVYPYTMTLEFSTTGDDMERGDAMIYDLRWSGMFESLDDDMSFNYSMAPLVMTAPDPLLYPTAKTNDMVPVKVQVTVSVCAPAKELNVFYFAMKALDETGNVSPLSNVVRVEFEDEQHRMHCPDPTTNTAQGRVMPILNECCNDMTAFSMPQTPLDWDLEDLARLGRLDGNDDGDDYDSDDNDDEGDDDENIEVLG